MAKEKKEKELERVYVIPLRKEWLKAPRYKRAKKAIRAIREFLVKHMKVPERDLKKIKIDKWVNEAVWLRGIKKPPQKIKVKAVNDGKNIKVEFLGLPPKFKVEEERLIRKIKKAKKKEEEKSKKRKKEKKVKKETEEEKKRREEEEKREKETKEKEKILHAEAKAIKPGKVGIKVKPKAGPIEKREMFRKTLEK